MLGEFYASPSVQHSLLIDNYKDSWTFLGFWIPKNLVNEKRGIATRLNGENLAQLAFFYENHSSSNAKENQDNPVPNRMFQLSGTKGTRELRQSPGVYIILCIANNKRYYGQSRNVSARLSQHKSRLRNNKHEVTELQRDFNIYGEENFEFSYVFVSRDFPLDKRKAMEVELIARFIGMDLCYNKIGAINHIKENNPFYGHSHSEETRRQISESKFQSNLEKPQQGMAILLNGVVYPSISKASQETKHSRDTIRRWLNDENQKNCVRLDDSQPSKNLDQANILDPRSQNKGIAKACSIFGVTYESIADAARKRNVNRSIIQRLLRNDPENCYLIF